VLSMTVAPHVDLCPLPGGRVKREGVLLGRAEGARRRRRAGGAAVCSPVYPVVDQWSRRSVDRTNVGKLNFTGSVSEKL
jgi:hypothetical protein